MAIEVTPLSVVALNVKEPLLSVPTVTFPSPTASSTASCNESTSVTVESIVTVYSVPSSVRTKLCPVALLKLGVLLPVTALEMPELLLTVAAVATCSTVSVCVPTTASVPAVAVKALVSLFVTAYCK